MARSDAAAILRGAGFPVVYDRWPDGSSPQWPCIRYVQEGENDVHADDGRWFRIDVWGAWLVTEQKDDAAEEAVDRAFGDAGVIPSRIAESYASDERLRHVYYRFELPH